MVVPQRQRIAGNGAVVEVVEGWKVRCVACGRCGIGCAMPQRQRIAGNGAVVGRKAWASGTASCGPWKEPVVQELFGLPADDEGLLGSDGEDGAGESAEAVDGDAAVPAVNGIAVSIGRGDSVSGGRAAGVGITGSAVRRVLPRNSNRHSLLRRGLRRHVRSGARPRLRQVHL